MSSQSGQALPCSSTFPEDSRSRVGSSRQTTFTQLLTTVSLLITSAVLHKKSGGAKVENDSRPGMLPRRERADGAVQCGHRATDGSLTRKERAQPLSTYSMLLLIS